MGHFLSGERYPQVQRRALHAGEDHSREAQAEGRLTASGSCQRISGKRAKSPSLEHSSRPSDVKRAERFEATRDLWIGARIAQASSPSSSTPSPLRKRCQVAQATEEHRSHPGKQQSADLEAAKGKRTAKTHNDRDRAENYADDPANPTRPEQQLIHRWSAPIWLKHQ